MKDFKENVFGKTDNKSIFSYVTDNVNYTNKNECSNYTPPFVSYVPIGVPNKNIDIDSNLRGINQYLSKCTEYKYRQEDTIPIDYKKNEKECDKSFNIVPFGYIPSTSNNKNDK